MIFSFACSWVVSCVESYAKLGAEESSRFSNRTNAKQEKVHFAVDLFSQTMQP